MKDEQKLLQKLDSIRIGSTKLHVNTPRFGREARQNLEKQPNTRVLTREHKTQKVWREFKYHQSNAQVVKDSSNNSQQLWKGISFEVEEVETKWLEGCYIGRVINYSRVNIVMEEVIQKGQGCLCTKYLGENVILLQPNQGAEIDKLIGDNKEWWADNFESITQWNSSLVVNNKMVWVIEIVLDHNGCCQ